MVKTLTLDLNYTGIYYKILYMYKKTTLNKFWKMFYKKVELFKIAPYKIQNNNKTKIEK